VLHFRPYRSKRKKECEKDAYWVDDGICQTWKVRILLSLMSRVDEKERTDERIEVPYYLTYKTGFL
jgi:hypothetical protein